MHDSTPANGFTVMMTWDTLKTGDCIETMNGLPAGSVHLAFADPPFNIGYEYDQYDDSKAKADYLAWTEQWLAAVRRVLRPDGSFFVAIGDEYAAEMKVRLDALGMTMRNWIIWHYTFGVNCTKKFNRSHAHIFYYVADPKNFTFIPDEIRVASARMTTYADRRANPVGKLPDDTWVLRPQETTTHFQGESDTWSVSRVCGTFKERTGHPCQMPEAVLERIIRCASRPGDIVLDPFAGSGTTLAVAKKLGRKFFGCELSPAYADAVWDRLSSIDMERERAVKSEPRRPGGTKRTQAAGLRPVMNPLFADA